MVVHASVAGLEVKVVVTTIAWTAMDVGHG